MKTLPCLLACLFVSVSLFSQSFNYTQEAASLDSAIQSNFYLADSNYYRELAKGEKAEKPVSYLWPLCALIQADNEMETLFSKKSYLPKTIGIIQKYYDKQPPAPGYDSYSVEFGGGDRFYDDNQWIGIAALDAYKRTGKQEYLSIGKIVYDFMMTGFDTASGGGLYWTEPKKTSKNTCSNGPGVLVALQMYEATKNRAYLDTALLIYNWTNKHLQSPAGLYYDNIKIPSLKIDSFLFSYNSGTMLESSVYLYQLTKDKKYLDAAHKTANSAKDYFLGSGRLRDDYWFSAVLLRGFLRLYAVEKNPVYVEAFQKCINNALQTEKQANGLFKRKKQTDNLVNQGGMLEMLARLASFAKNQPRRN